MFYVMTPCWTGVIKYVNDCYHETKGAHGSNDPMVNTLIPPRPIHSSHLPLHSCVLPSWKEGVALT